MLTCVIRYEIDPTKRSQFGQYARNWGKAIPRCGADLIGYFAPHEGSATLAYGIYNVASLAEYEAYRARLAADPLGPGELRVRAAGALHPSGRPDVAQARVEGGRRRGMIVVIFEVEPAEGRKDEYLEIAANLKPMLDEIDGFISVERFQSLTDPSRILSLSFFEDEEAVRRWRTTTAHRKAQARGRSGTFAEYRLRIASVIRDYGMFEREQAPQDSRDAHSA